MFLDHKQRRSTVGRTPLDERSVRRRDLYLTTHDTHNRKISMPPVGFEPTISAGERPQTYALDRAATGTGGIVVLLSLYHGMALQTRYKIMYNLHRQYLAVRITHFYITEEILEYRTTKRGVSQYRPV